MPIETTNCGPGSTEANTRNIREFLRFIVNKYDIKSVNDIGCGDLYWTTLDQWDFDYIGYDVTIREVAVDRMQPTWCIADADITDFMPRECDLTICKDVFRHHDKKAINAIIEKINGYLLADYDDTTEIYRSWHQKLKDGQQYNLNGNKVDLRDWLGDPIESVVSNEHDGKRFGLWRLSIIQSSRQQ